MWSTRCQSRYKWWKIDFSNWCTRDCDLNFLVKHKKWIKIDFAVLYCMVWTDRLSDMHWCSFTPWWRAGYGWRYYCCCVFCQGGALTAQNTSGMTGGISSSVCVWVCLQFTLCMPCYGKHSKRNQRCESLKPSKVFFQKLNSCISFTIQMNLLLPQYLNM